MNDYTLTWVEDGTPVTVYLRVTDTAATALAEGLSLHDVFTDVTLTRQETVAHAVTLRKKA